MYVYQDEYEMTDNYHKVNITGLPITRMRNRDQYRI